ncbi:MAG TPA: Rieske (2Fe-2S) protein [Candidatus Binatia bacterium]|nr:Rieske (2Fe-2S) protein [Candidatus Binatia bacterium]
MSDATTPKWRADFPLTSEGEDEVTRREFARYLVLASAAFATASVGVAAWTSLRPINRGAPRPIVAASALRTGEAFLFRYPTDLDPAILVQLSNGELRAFSQKCTHLGCVVYWNDASDEMLCPCHDGVFDAHDGHVVAGPPQRPLGRIAVERRDDGMIWALGAEAT